MSWTNDPELQQMFVSELGERSGRLLEGARAMQAGTIESELAGAMLREGHTIKGTSRVMGFDVLSTAAQLVEQLWRDIQHGDSSGSPAIGEALEAVASAIPAAAVADPELGTPELVAAIEQLRRATGESAAADTAPLADPATILRASDAVGEPVPPPATPASPSPEPDPSAPEASVDVPPLDVRPSPPVFGAAPAGKDLGGLLGALDSWASEQTMAVNAGRLYRLINRIADIRNEVGSVQAHVGDEHPTYETLGLLGSTMADLQHEALALAAVPFTGMTNSLPQLVRYLAKKLGKEVRFEAFGDVDLAIDRQVIDTISDPIRQLIVNALRHGIESPAVRKKVGKPTTGSVSLVAAIKDRKLEIVITDDGAGVDWEAVRAQAIEQDLYPAHEGIDIDELRTVLFSEGFSTVGPGDLGGDGAGLSAVARAVETLFGRIKLESTAGVGTTITLTVPTSVALQRVLMLEEAGVKWGLPEAIVDEVIPILGAAVVDGEQGPELDWHGRTIPIVSFGELVGSSSTHDANHILITSHRLGEMAVTAEAVDGVREVAVKELGPVLSGPSHISGAALLGGGDVVLVLETATIFDRSFGAPRPSSGQGLRVLVVDDSVGARAVVSGALASSGFSTSVASSVAEALDVLQTEGADAVVVDFSMPHEDGIALIDQVRARFGDLPVVMLSGVATHEDQERARRAGVDAFFEKTDFREGALAQALREMLASRGAAR